MTSGEALFNLKAVVRQTGIKPDTLRAWERRYGLPTPRRSTGGHRLYSHRDIDTIKWLTARQQEGLSIKRAVEQWRQIAGIFGAGLWVAGRIKGRPKTNGASA